MMMLEHEAKTLLDAAGVRVPAGVVVRRGKAAAERACAKVARYPVAVKAQVRGGGRGKQGGVVKAEDSAALSAAISQIFTMEFGGEHPQEVLVEPWLAIERELYLAVTVDGRADGYVVMYSPRGGIDIEDGPAPARYPIGPAQRFRTHEMRAILTDHEADYQVREKVIALAQRLTRAAALQDCTTVEINPLVKLTDGEIVAADAKVVRDEWAAFRNRGIADQREQAKRRADRLLRGCLDMQHMYVRLDGDVALISGGAGMTMAAMDMIAEHGGRPACFLDCSPGPTSTRGYRPAFVMLDADPQVKVILVSVFGGGTQMQRVANSMKEIMAERKSKKPVVFRLDGTNVDQVPGIFSQFGARNHACLEDAVAEAVRLAKGAQ
ncbi:MAG TPA: ATP-grasp domain-containing protein [Burkholderiales bacterium]|nr:ATP-grasp domain-containing protein [Burkholderiales bacterium]